MKFFIVDAFSDQLFGGNPAGVVLIEAAHDFPPTETMRLVAAELRYSETAFVKQLSESTFHTRYFTPEAEVDLCGHATIATFHALVQAKVIVDPGEYVNQTLAGHLTISLRDGRIFMEMGRPTSLGVIQDPVAIQEIYTVLGIPERAMEISSELLPEIISTGLPDIIVAVPDEAALAAIRPDFPALSLLSQRYHVVGVHAYTVGGDGRFHVRNFAPLYGIDEEAATGTANGALTYYLYQRNLISDREATEFIQGEAMQRPSVVQTLIRHSDDQLTIYVGGQAVILAQGDISLNG